MMTTGFIKVKIFFWFSLEFERKFHFELFGLSEFVSQIWIKTKNKVFTLINKIFGGEEWLYLILKRRKVAKTLRTTALKRKLKTSKQTE